MKKLLLIFAAILLCTMGYAQLNPPVNENFDGATFPPAGWTQQQFVGSENWTKSGNPVMYRGAGAAYAMIDAVSTTALISPAISIPVSGNFKLAFWTKFMWPDLTASYEVWISKTDNSTATSFTSVKTLSGTEISETEWKEIVVNLEDDYNGESIYVAFVTKAVTAGFYAWAVDDFELMELTNNPVFQGNASFDMGIAYNNVAYPTTKDYTITNKGGSTLTINSLVSASPEISLATSLPLSIEPSESKTLQVVIDANTTNVSAGAYNGNFKLATNDPAQPEVTVNVTATVQAAALSGYFMEGFEGSAALPAGWTSKLLSVKTDGKGYNSNNYLNTELYGTRKDCYVQTCYVNMGSNPYMSFQYKITEWLPAGTATPAENLSMKVRITKDGSEWDTIYKMEVGEHTPSTDYALKSIDVSAYANETCVVEIWFYHAAGDFYVDIDDITIGTPPNNELAATSLKGTAVPSVNKPATYTVVVKNNGTATQDNTSYSVKLMQEGNIRIDSVAGVSIAQGESKEFEFIWTPNTEVSTYFWGEIVMTGDEVASNNKTGNLSIKVQPANITGITLNEGNATSNAPINFQYTQSVSQSLYLPSEIGFNGGTVNGLVYKTKLADARNNEAVKVYIGESDKTEMLNSGRVDPQTLTLVFDGTLDFSSADGAEVLIPFSTPYNYQGGGLVICVYRPVATAHTAQDLFYAKTIAGSNRTLVSGFIGGSSSADPMGSDFANYLIGMSPTDNIPMVTLMMDMSNIGSLSGVISNESTPLDSVKVQLVGGNLSVMTNATGEYTFPYLTSGTHTFEFSKFGYHTTTAEVNITAGNEIEKDLNLPLIVGHSVSGKISGSNAPDGLENATVVLRGYENYKTTTNASGNYSFPDVYDENKYEMAVIAGGYLAYIDSVEVNGTAVVRDIVLNETPYPVLNATAAVAGSDAVVIWDKPEAISTFRYDNGNIDGQFGFGSGNQYGVMGSAHRESATLNKMSWYLNDWGGEQTAVNVFVFALDSVSGLPTNKILYSATDVPTQIDQWSSYEFSTPVEAPTGFFIALSRNSGFLSLGTSEPTAEYPFMPQSHFYCGNYNTIVFSAVEAPTPDDPDGAAFNFMIRAEGESLGEVVKFGPSLHAFPKPTPVGYNVYRFEENASEAAWTELATVTDTFYTDDWASLADGKVYQYAVKAEYTDDSLSKATLTNVQPKAMEVAYTINLSTNSGDSPEGAVVILSNEEHSYTQTASVSVAVVNFTAVWRGTYNLSITKEGFAEISVNDIVIDQNGLSRKDTLKEIIVTPFNLEINVDKQNATFSWNNAPYTFCDSMEDYNNFAISGIGQYTLIDGDNAPTFENFGGIRFENVGYTGSYIVMSPSMTTPTSNTPAFLPYSGNRYLACIATSSSEANNDWLILPKLSIANGSEFKFYAANFTMMYDTARFKVAVSTSGTNAEDFTVISKGDYVYAPYGKAGVGKSWEELSYDLSDYAGQEVYIAIICVSDDNSSMLMIDNISLSVSGGAAGSAVSSVGGDVTVGVAGSALNGSKSFGGYTVYLDEAEIETGVAETEYEFTDLEIGDHIAGVQAFYSTGSSSIEKINFTVSEAAGIEITNRESFTVYPNPVVDVLNIQTTAVIKEITVIDQTGKVVKVQKGDRKDIGLQSLSAGQYIVRICTATGISSVKIVKK